MDRSQLLDIDGLADHPIFDEAVKEVAKPVVPALDENFITRQEAARLAAVGVGIEWPKTILPEGTALYESGVQKLKADRARWQRLPFAADAIPVITAALVAEDRRDDKVKVKELYVQPADGSVLYIPENSDQHVALGYDRHAFSQLVAQTNLKDGPRGTAATLLFLDPTERAQVLNSRLPASEAIVTARTKVTHNGHRVARAFLSQRYADINDIHVAEALQGALNGDAKVARLDYKPGDERSRFEVIFPSEIPVETFRVGDVHYAVLTVDNSETGEGSLKVTAGLLRAACANLTLAGGSVSIRHAGNAENRRAQTRLAIKEALALLDPLVQAITVSARTVIPDNESASSIIEQLAKKYELREERAQAWLNTYEAGYSHSPTVWGLSSALTESAQSLDWWTEQAAEDRSGAPPRAPLRLQRSRR
jgi:hypothetical protein